MWFKKWQMTKEKKTNKLKIIFKVIKYIIDKLKSYLDNMETTRVTGSILP